MIMNTTRTEAKVLADAHQLIAENPGITAGQLQERGVGAAFWAIEQLMARGMVVRLANVAGRDCVESRYATVRAAKAAK